MQSKAFAIYSWGVLGFTLLIIAWGAFVRATGSGAGCGNHWPTCNGQVLPRTETMETMIEYTHRITGGLGGLLMIGLVIWAFRCYPRRHAVRWGATISLVFFIIEGLIGAGLVRFELVADNASIARAFAISAHLVNTFILLTFMALTAWWASGGKTPNAQAFPNPPPLSPPLAGGRTKGGSYLHRDSTFGLLIIGLFAILLLGMTGAITALGDTLFPDESLVEGLRQDFSPTVNSLKRLRIIHPFLAFLTGLYIAYLGNKFRTPSYSSQTRNFARSLIWLFFIQLGVGVVNVILLAPVWMQLVHLLLADLVWIVLVLLSASVLAEEQVYKGVTDPISQKTRKIIRIYNNE